MNSIKVNKFGNGYSSNLEIIKNCLKGMVLFKGVFLDDDYLVYGGKICYECLQPIMGDGVEIIEDSDSSRKAVYIHSKHLL